MHWGVTEGPRTKPCGPPGDSFASIAQMENFVFYMLNTFSTVRGQIVAESSGVLRGTDRDHQTTSCVHRWPQLHERDTNKHTSARWFIKMLVWTRQSFTRCSRNDVFVYLDSSSLAISRHMWLESEADLKISTALSGNTTHSWDTCHIYRGEVKRCVAHKSSG